MKCGQVTAREYKSIQLRDPKTWICNSCLLNQPLSACGFDESDLLTALPFSSLSDDSFSSVIGTHTPPLSDVLPKDDECESLFTDLIHQLSKCSTKDLKVAHLNICSLRNKIDELRCLQLLCKFEVLAITETHLDQTVLDTALNIDGMKLLRLDRKGRKGGGCALYFADHLHAIHRKDLFIEGLEAIWLQVKISSTQALFSVIYRPPDDNLFFERINTPLEKAWLRSENIFLKIIKTRNYKRMDVEKFKYDLERTPFHIASIFEDPDDHLWVWERLFDDISNEHAPWREIKARSFSSSWITCEIRHKMNRRYKLFKAAISSKCPEQWSKYKRVRNEVTSDLRNTKSSYFSTIFNEVKSSSAYWNLLKRATNPKARKNIGPLKKEDNTLEFTDSGKANLINSYFATIGLKLSNTLPPPTSCGHGITCADKGETDTPRLTDVYISKSLVAEKIKALKTRKSTGPDNIPLKLLKLAGDAIVPSLLSLFRLSITTGRVFTSWKTARLTPVYKKDDETDCCNYRPISLLSVPSKILESVVNDTIVGHVYKANNLVTDKQWAYRAGFSTELLLIQLTETWREAVHAGLVVAVAFIDFKKVFDSVSHAILETKLERDFGISGLLLYWLKSYLKERQQYTAVNGSTSEMIPISFGIPQGCVLGLTLFTLFTNDLPSSVSSGSVYMFADDTTVYCISDTAEKSIAKLNSALRELNEWCLINRLTPHPSKSEAMLISRRNPPVNIPPILIGNSTIEWVSKSRLLGMTVDEKLTWTQHMLELKKSFAKKLGLLKKARFLPNNVRQDLYFKIILPSVTYGLILWGSDLFQSLERLHCRAARLIFHLPKDMASADVLQLAQWPTLSIYYKLAIFICLHKAFHDRLPVTLIDLISKKRATNYLTRTCASLIVPRFNTRYMKDSVAFRGSVLWNAVTNNCSALTNNIPYRDLTLKLKSQANFNEFSFKITSASTCNFRKDDFVYTKFYAHDFIFVSVNLVQTFCLYIP